MPFCSIHWTFLLRGKFSFFLNLNLLGSLKLEFKFTNYLVHRMVFCTVLLFTYLQILLSGYYTQTPCKHFSKLHVSSTPQPCRPALEAFLEPSHLAGHLIQPLLSCAEPSVIPFFLTLGPSMLCLYSLWAMDVSAYPVALPPFNNSYLEI